MPPRPFHSTMACMTQRHHRPSWLRNIWKAAAVGLLVTGSVGCGRLWAGEPYPVADPVTTASRLDGYTQTTYDALDLPNAELDTDWPGAGAEARGDSCHYRGLRHLDKQISDSPPGMPGVVSVHTEWALKGVPEVEALSAMRRAREELTRRGWRVTDSMNKPYWHYLVLKPSGSDDEVRIWTYPHGRLEVAAYSDCARYPTGTRLDPLDAPVLPQQVAPTQLRG